MSDLAVSEDVAKTLPANFFELYDVERGIEAALLGRPGREIAKAMGLSEWHYCRLRYKYPLFKQAMDRARAEGHDAIADSILTIVEDNPLLHPQAIKIKFDAITTYLKWMDPNRFGDRLHIKEEHVDLKGALIEAKTRIINVSSTPVVDPFEE